MGATMVKFNARQLRWNLLDHFINEQSKLLVDYARDEIMKIGKTISEYNSAHNLDRHGNLLDSLCWGVSFNGKLVDYGFYREQTAEEASYLHEWFGVEFEERGTKGRMGGKDFMPEVWGHDLADAYAHKYGNNGSKGWKVFFAILAPYWGYWEKGFSMHHGYSSKGGFMGATFTKFAVMTQYYDEVKRDLKPMKVRFRVSVAKYTNMGLKRKAVKAWNGR